MTKTQHLFVYDYGTGGVWGFMTAEAAAQVSAKYPRLTVVEKRPSWMDDAQLEQIRLERSYDIDQEPDDFLRAVLSER